WRTIGTASAYSKEDFRSVFDLPRMRGQNERAAGAAEHDCLVIQQVKVIARPRTAGDPAGSLSQSSWGYV
ncbi:MAG: hypothetical protein O3C21_09240, partial [Verrucomicrobia bacterium]|nr:hypothetical protein [Verrucomicrobiota bacterium]